MGFGRMAMVTFMLIILSIAFVTAFSMAANDAPTDGAYGNGTTVKNMVVMTQTTTGTTANLFPAIVIISGILLLASAFMIFRKVG